MKNKKTTQTKVQPKVSIIVPIYRVEKYLVQCLDSIVNQTLKDIEIILVDEGDMDACRYIIDHYEQTDKRVIAIHEKNGGYGASVNKGFDIAKGEYIGIIESDDFIAPEMFEEMYNYAKQTGADVVKTPYYEYWSKKGDKKDVTKVCHYKDFITKESPKDEAFSIMDYPQQMSVHASLWSGIYKTSYIREKNIRFIQAKGGAYVDVGFRIDTLINTDKIAWLSKPYYYYRVDAEGSTTNNFKLGAMLQRWAEAHEAFETKYKGKYDTVGKYLIIDEYLNTVGQCFNFYPTEEEFKLLQSNLSKIDDKIINESPVLSQDRKAKMLKAKYAKDREDFFSTSSKGPEPAPRKLSLFKKIFSIDRDNQYGHSMTLFGKKIKLYKEPKPVKPAYILEGENNKIIIVENGKERVLQPHEKIPGLNVKVNGNNNTIRIIAPFKIIESNITLNRNNNCNITISKPNSFRLDLAFWGGCDNSSFFIDEKSGITGKGVVNFVESNAHVTIGKNFLCSGGLNIWTQDGHSILDMDDNILNLQKEYRIIIGDNVWIGNQVSILKNVIIPNNTIIGLRSIVTKKFTEENTLIAGNPAVITKRNIKWHLFNCQTYASTYPNKVSSNAFASNKCKIVGKNNKLIFVENGVEEVATNADKLPAGLRISINGDNNTVKIHLPLEEANNSFIEIGNDGAYVEIGEKVTITNMHIRCCFSENQKCIVGKETILRGGAIILDECTSCYIGKCCRIGGGLEIRGADGHAILDKDSKEILNRPKNAIKIGDHCWFAAGVRINKNVSIPNGTIVGAMSIITKQFEKENTILVGAPAKVVKENVIWTGHSIYSLEKQNPDVYELIKKGVFVS